MKTEPVMLAMVVKLALTMLAYLGIVTVTDATVEQTIAAVTAVWGGLELLINLYLRHKVTPTTGLPKDLVNVRSRMRR